MNELDVKKLAIAKLAYDWAKKVLEEPKDSIRTGLKIPENDYLNISTRDYNTSKYSDEDQARIDQFIADNGIKKLPLSTPNHIVNYNVKDKAKEEFKQMLSNLGINA